jgi:alpha-L-arabinofuranosidase
MPHAQLTVDPHFAVGGVNRRFFGSFVEHLGRCVYDGIYEPSHPLSDNDGFRTDVLELVCELGVSTIRYPAGNFVSGFRWEDAIGPREDRPTGPGSSATGARTITANSRRGRRRRCGSSTDAWRQTTFLPLAVTSRLAVGSSLLVKLESDTYQTGLHGEVPTVDAVATHDPERIRPRSSW